MESTLRSAVSRLRPLLYQTALFLPTAQPGSLASAIRLPAGRKPGCNSDVARLRPTSGHVIPLRHACRVSVRISSLVCTTSIRISKVVRQSIAGKINNITWDQINHTIMYVSDMSRLFSMRPQDLHEARFAESRHWSTRIGLQIPYLKFDKHRGICTEASNAQRNYSMTSIHQVSNWWLEIFTLNLWDCTEDALQVRWLLPSMLSVTNQHLRHEARLFMSVPW